MELDNPIETPAGFDIAYITKCDYPNVLAHLEKNFYTDEPVNKAFGTSTDRVADQNTRYTDMLNRYEKCLYSTRISTSNEKEICGVLIVHLHDLNNPIPSFTPCSPITVNFSHFLEQMESKFNVFQHYSLTAFPELAILSVDKSTRGQGLAMKLCNTTISQLFSDGAPLIYAEFSNPLSRRIGARLGFKEVAQFSFNEFNSIDNSCKLSNMDSSNFVSLMILEQSDYERSQSVS